MSAMELPASSYILALGTPAWLAAPKTAAAWAWLDCRIALTWRGNHSSWLRALARPPRNSCSSATTDLSHTNETDRSGAGFAHRAYLRPRSWMRTLPSTCLGSEHVLAQPPEDKNIEDVEHGFPHSVADHLLHRKWKPIPEPRATIRSQPHR